MVFNSLSYLLFLPGIFLLFTIVPDRLRWLLLLVASYVFYGFLLKPYLLFVLAIVTANTFYFGNLIDKFQDITSKKCMLWLGVMVNVAFLIYFKYVPFLVDNLSSLLGTINGSLGLAMMKPLYVSIGLSFFVFQSISYLFDIYLEIEKPERHFGRFALYLAFFPKLLQGPIERAGDLLPQLKTSYTFNKDNIRFGVFLFVLGLFKKIVIADRLGLYVDMVYDDVNAYSGLPLLFATYAYAVQIYMDFSGYTDMALGSAQLFNIDLTQNFNKPYLATSIADFWRRWHITFSRWILDYIFKPLQMQWRYWKNWGTATALIITFLVSGLWHGASWGFVVWGGLHGLYMACSVFYKPYQKKLHKALGVEKTTLLKAWQVLVTFNLVSFAWVFFRARNLSDAFWVLQNAFNFNMINNINFIGKFDKYELYVGMISLSLAIVIDIHGYLDGIRDNNKHINAATIILIYLITLFAVDGSSRFIYTNF